VALIQTPAPPYCCLIQIHCLQHDTQCIGGTLKLRSKARVEPESCLLEQQARSLSLQLTLRAQFNIVPAGKVPIPVRNTFPMPQQNKLCHPLLLAQIQLTHTVKGKMTHRFYRRGARFYGGPIGYAIIKKML
jgi:hypothetical protein